MTPRLHRLLVLLALLLPIACGGGGSSGSGGGAASLALHVDTAAGSSDLISARITAVVLEASDGSLGSNLLPAATTVTLVDPTGASAGLALRTPTATAAVAVHLLVEGGVASVRRADGSNGIVTLPGSDLRLAFASATVVLPTTLLGLSHNGVPSLTARAGGGFDWTPDLRVAAVADVVLSVADAEVMSVDRANGRMIVTLGGFQDLSFELSVPSTAHLVGEDGGGRGRDDFLAECSSGSQVSFDGISHSSREVECHSLHHHGAEHGELELIGRITALDAGTSHFTLDVQAARRRGVLVDFATGPIDVDASSAAIHLSRHSVQTAVGFGDLSVGALVEVEGSDPSGGAMTARSISLEDDQQHHQQGETEGEVVGVDVGAGTISVGPRGNDPLLLGGAAVTGITVTVDAATSILRRNGSSLTAITLGDILARDRIAVRGEITAPQELHASWVRVESR
ncbi:MAG: DUF5666 domain-containing protein [Planctomycetota bacterium]